MRCHPTPACPDGWVRRRALALIPTLAVAAVLTPFADAQLPQPSEYQMGVGAGGFFRTIAGRNGVLLAGSDVDGLFRSLDGGRTWHLANTMSTESRESGIASVMINDILWHPTIENRVIVATMDGIYVSDNPARPEGPEWTRVTPGTNAGLGLSDGFRPGFYYPPGSYCRNGQYRNSRQAGVAALTAYVDPGGNTTLFGVSGMGFFLKAPQKDTNRDLLWVSTDGGDTWTYHRIRLPAPPDPICSGDPILSRTDRDEDPHCSANPIWNNAIYNDPASLCPKPANYNQFDWRRTFIDVEVHAGRVFVAALEGQGVLSAPLSNLDPWRRENSGLPYGCYGGYEGHHPAQMTHFLPDLPGATEQLYLSVFSTGPAPPPCMATATSFGVYRWDPDAGNPVPQPHWVRADEGSANPLPAPATSSPASPYYSYLALQSFETPDWRALFTAMPNGYSIGDNRGAIYKSRDGVNWHALAPAYWLDHESELNACGTDGIYRQLGADYGPFEWGLDRYACRGGNLLEWYPNPHYQFGTARVFQAGSPPSAHDERLYTWMPGLYEVDPDYDETPPATPPARPMTLLTSTEVVEGCAVASQRDFHDNALRCWADASVAGLPDISLIPDVELFDGKLWLARADWSGSQWRYDLARRHWEEFLMPMNVPYVRDLTTYDNYDADMGTEIWTVASRPGSPSAGDAPCGQDLVYPMLVFGGGEMQLPPYRAGLIIKGLKCEGQWHFDAIGMIDEAPNPQHPLWNKVCPYKIAGNTAQDDLWEPCRGNVIDLAYLPPQPGDGTNGEGRFFAASSGQVCATQTVPRFGEVGIYTSIDGDVWVKLPPDASAGYPDWWDSSHCKPDGCVGNTDPFPFAFSQTGNELFMSFRGNAPFSLPIASVSGLWRWRTDASRVGGGVFEAIPMTTPLLAIGGVARDANGRIIVATGMKYHPSAPAGSPYDAGSLRAGIYRCQGGPGVPEVLPSCESWTTLLTIPDWDFPGADSYENKYLGLSGGLVATDRLGNSQGSFLFASWYANNARSSGGIPLAVSEDGGLTWSFRALSKQFRAALGLRILPLGGHNHLALLGQAGLYILDFDCVDNDRDGYGATSGASCPAGSSEDCSDSDPAVWARPTGVRTVKFDADEQTLSWDAPAAAGTRAEALVYDTLRAGTPYDFGSAACLESDDGPERTAEDPETPAPGPPFFYLVRAVNRCPDGEGPLGNDSSGTPRQGRACP